MYQRAITALAVLTLLFASGCSTNQNWEFKSYTSPLKYANDDCRSLNEKAEIVDAEIRELFPSAGPRTVENSVVMGLGLFVFWPAFFLIQNVDASKSLAYTRLKGDVEAISNTAAQKHCNFLPQEASVR